MNSFKFRNFFTSSSKGVAVLSATFLVCMFVVFFILTLERLNLSFNFSILSQYRVRFFQGFRMTLVLSICSMILSLLLGFIAVAGVRSKIVPVSQFFRAYVQIIRGTPLLVQIFFFYYIIGSAWGIENRYLAGVLILSIFEGAYITEIFRGGLESIGRQQSEIAKAIGLNTTQTFRLVVFPQLMMRILPSLTGQFASIIKDSSLLSVIAVIELTQVTQEISSINYALFENYLFLGGLYLLMTMPVSFFSKYLEKKFKYAH